MNTREKVEAAFGSRFPTNGAAATWLFPRISKGTTKPCIDLAKKIAKGKFSEESLPKLIAALRAGDRLAWWEKHREAAEFLAKEIGIPVEDLLSDMDEDAIEFLEFPGLLPLSAEEPPCPIGPDGWLAGLGIEALPARGAQRWVVAPPGWGKSLLVRWIDKNLSDAFSSRSVGPLSAAVPFADAPTPLVIELEHTGPDDSASARTLLRRSASTVILAPFPPPASATEWEVLTFEPDPNWRDALLVWVQRRIERANRETAFDAATVRAWLDRHDADGRIVSSPGDLLALCADFDRDAEEGGLAERASRWLRRFGFRDAAGPAKAWGEKVGAEAFAAAVRSRFEDLGGDFDACSAEEWAGHLPAKAAPGSDGTAPGNLVAIGYLRDAGLLRGGDGGLTPFPRWVHHGLLHEDLAESFKGKGEPRWGSFAAAAARKHVVDHALDGLDDASLRSLVASISKLGPPGTLAATGAVEATFAAASRRLRRPGFELTSRDVPAWQALGKTQAAKLCEAGTGYPGLHHPFTARDIPRWLLDAWSFSFHIPPPADLPPHAFAWDFPGWFRPLSLEAAPGLPEFSAFAPWRTELAGLLDKLADVIEGREGPAAIPTLLLPALLAAPGAGDARLRGSDLHRLAGDSNAAVIEAFANAVPDERLSDLARRVWRLCPEAMKTKAGFATTTVVERIKYLAHHHPALVAKVLAHLEWSDLETAIRSDGLFGPMGDTSELGRLPRRLLQDVLDGWLDRPLERPTRWLEASELLPLIPPDDRGLLFRLIRSADLATSAEFVEKAWATDPIAAEAEALEAMERDLPSAGAWFDQAPRALLPRLAAEVEKRSPRPPWVKAWAFRRAIEAGPAQEKLFAWAHEAP